MNNNFENTIKEVLALEDYFNNNYFADCILAKPKKTIGVKHEK